MIAAHSHLTEREVLENALSECKRRLDRFRRAENWLEADLAEADLNAMLEKLHEFDTRERDTCTD